MGWMNTVKIRPRVGRKLRNQNQHNVIEYPRATQKVYITCSYRSKLIGDIPKPFAAHNDWARGLKPCPLCMFGGILLTFAIDFFIQPEVACR
jgi:hypothetical protein